MVSTSQVSAAVAGGGATLSCFSEPSGDSEPWSGIIMEVASNQLVLYMRLPWKAISQLHGIG